MKHFHQIFLWVFCILLFGNLSAQEEPKRLTYKYGEKINQCSSPYEDAYYALYQNPNNFAIDVIIALKEKTGEWKIFEKQQMAAGDTMQVYTCNSDGGKTDKDFRKAGTSLPLRTYDDFNVEYLKAHPRQIPQQQEVYTDMYAKILYGKDPKKPMVNQKVALKDTKGDVVQSTVTDQYGDFAFTKINSIKELELFLERNPNLSPDEKLFLAKQNGTVLSEFLKDAENNFVYKLLPADFKKLSLIEEEEDPFLAVKGFENSANKDLLVADNIYYKEGSVELLPEALQKLDKVILILKQNSSLSVEMLSHTDAKGDDNSNLKLSEERAKMAIQYILSKGVEAKRVSGKGYGESVILNRCKNGIDCSEKEHRLNRRTEFKFRKN